MRAAIQTTDTGAEITLTCLCNNALARLCNNTAPCTGGSPVLHMLPGHHAAGVEGHRQAAAGQVHDARAMFLQRSLLLHGRPCMVRPKAFLCSTLHMGAASRSLTLSIHMPHSHHCFSAGRLAPLPVVATSLEHACNYVRSNASSSVPLPW